MPWRVSYESEIVLSSPPSRKMLTVCNEIYRSALLMDEEWVHWFPSLLHLLLFFYLMFFLCCILVANLPLCPWFFITCLTNCCHYSAVPSLGSSLVRWTSRGQKYSSSIRGLWGKFEGFPFMRVSQKENQHHSTRLTWLLTRQVNNSLYFE